MKLVLLILSIAPLFGQAPAMAVVEKKAGMVGFYAADGKRLSEVKVGSFPHETAFSPDRRFLYVTDNGLLWMTDPGEGFNTISIIEVATRKKTGTIDLGSYRRPHGIAVLPKTGQIVTTIENPDGLLLVDPVARKVVRKYDVKGKSPFATDKNEVSGEIQTGANPARVELTPDEKTLVYNLQSGEGIGFVDVQARKQVAEVRLPGRPLSLSLSR